jgi:hypothetical protein
MLRHTGIDHTGQPKAAADLYVWCRNVGAEVVQWHFSGSAVLVAKRERERERELTMLLISTTFHQLTPRALGLRC